MKEIQYTILYCVCEDFSDIILLRFRNCNNLRFQLFDKSRFWFHTANGYGYSSTTLDSRFSKEVSQKLPEPFKIGLNRNTGSQFFYFA